MFHPSYSATSPGSLMGSCEDDHDYLMGCKCAKYHVLGMVNPINFIASSIIFSYVAKLILHQWREYTTFNSTYTTFLICCIAICTYIPLINFIGPTTIEIHSLFTFLLTSGCYLLLDKRLRSFMFYPLALFNCGAIVICIRDLERHTVSLFFSLISFLSRISNPWFSSYTQSSFYHLFFVDIGCLVLLSLHKMRRYKRKEAVALPQEKMGGEKAFDILFYLCCKFGFSSLMMIGLSVYVEPFVCKLSQIEIQYMQLIKKVISTGFHPMLVYYFGALTLSSFSNIILFVSQVIEKDSDLNEECATFLFEQPKCTSPPFQIVDHRSYKFFRFDVIGNADENESEIFDDSGSKCGDLQEGLYQISEQNLREKIMETPGF